jgi:hypothetical protein
MKEILRMQNSAAISSPTFYPASLLDVSAHNYHKSLLDEPGMIRNQMRTKNKSEMLAVQESPCASTPQG